MIRLANTFAILTRWIGFDFIRHGQNCCNTSELLGNALELCGPAVEAET